VIDHAHLFAFGPCWSCGLRFTFDPDLVPSIPIDPLTNRPSDMGGDPDLVVRQPICGSCVEAANVNRRRDGRPLIVVLPGAYGP
jgi:hypothetical protein